MTLFGVVFCAVASTLQVPSASMGRAIPVAVVLPRDYETSGCRYPVVTCLHGVGGTYQTFLDPPTFSAVDEHGFIAVLPQSGPSWWFDSPVVATNRFETFVAKELVGYVDSHYRTCPCRSARALVGASMGGHGACWIGFRHSDVFGAVGSIYGGVDIMPFSDKFGISNVLGAKEGNEELWRAHSCLTAAAALKPGDLEIIICVGTEDFFLDANRRLHKILNERGIRHSYLEIAGVDKSHSSHHEDFKRMVEPFVFGHIARYFNHRWRDGLRAGAVEDNIK